MIRVNQWLNKRKLVYFNAEDIYYVSLKSRQPILFANIKIDMPSKFDFVVVLSDTTIVTSETVKTIKSVNDRKGLYF